MSWQKREFKGCTQYREITESGKGKWQFQVLGFEYLGVYEDCRVMAPDGFIVAKMDNDRNLIIDGKKYNSQHWNH